MRLVVQHVSEASVSINGELFSSINNGLVVFLGIEKRDTCLDVDWLCQKIAGLRIFSDENGLMNKSIIESSGSILIVSQFTLIASYKKGNRPSFIYAARPEQAAPLYHYFIEKISSLIGQEVKTGIFGADMKVRLVNDGPVTIIMDTHNKE